MSRNWQPPAMRKALTLALVTSAALGTAVATSASPAVATSRTAFHRASTYPVFENRPAGEAAATATAAEISAITDDGRTVIYTDSPGRRIGFVDISDPARPVGEGTLSLAQLGDAEDEPTSVTVVGGYALVVVDTSESFTAPSGRLDVVRISDRTKVRSFDLGGQPDSIAVDKSDAYAIVAIENQRDEDATPPGKDEGDLPQLPAGFAQVLKLGRKVSDWTLEKVPFTAADGSALPVLSRLTEPTDPEPEYVSINSRGEAVVSLQENNGVAVVDLRKAAITRAFSTGTVSLTGIDTKDDKVIDQTGSITDVPREPDGVAWIDDTYVATANEGDWKGGTRGWSIFDSRSGKAVWDAGTSFERLAITYGLHDDSRSDNKGPEPENVVVTTIRGTRYAFVAAERSNFVAVYSLANPTRPVFQQVLPTTNGPEGIAVDTRRGLLVVSSETDAAANGVRASLSTYRLGKSGPEFPSIVSADVQGVPIGWGALGALSAKPGSKHELYTVTDAAYSPTRILTVDTDRSPALISKALTVTDAGKAVGLDAEGIFARPQGGFWLGVEGATGPANRIVRLDDAGALQQSIPLPAEIGGALGAQGIEGVTAIVDKSGEHVFVALQRELSTDPKGTVRIGRYDVASATWTWFGYPLETPQAAPDWMGLSEITAIDGETLAVIERDKLNGPAAKVKRIYSVRLPAADPAAGTLPVLTKTLVKDVLPVLRATGGWTQEKLEGMTVGGDGRLYAITDNDGLSNATGETVFLDLGSARKLFR